MLKLLALLIIAISSVYGQNCGGGQWKVSYSGQMCKKTGGQYRIQCQSKSNNCGMRLDSNPRLGRGTYQVSMKAAPGTGMNTAFYLFSYGRYNDKSRPWNEVDFELLGKTPKRIWTNVWTGHGVQHGKFISLGFDATKGFHTYKIVIDKTNIKFVIDGKTKRTFKYTGYSDLKQTINKPDFQGEISLWGATDNSWPDMGQVWDNNKKYPLYAYFKNVKLNKASGFTEEEEAASNTLNGAEIFAIIAGVGLFCCLLGGGFWYFRKRKQAGDVTFNHGDKKEDSKEVEFAAEKSGDTPVGDDGHKTTDGYDMSPVTPSQEEAIEIEVDVETQA